MRETGRWHLTDIQRFLVVFVVVVALFLSAMSLGMQSLMLLLVAALLLVVAGLAVFLLGLRYNGRGGMQGTAHVVEAPPPPIGKIVARCDLRLLVDLPGRPSTMMKLRDPSVAAVKWPYVGMVLPVEVPVDNPRTLRIRWEAVPEFAFRGESAGAATTMPMPIVTEYTEEIHLPGLEYDYSIKDSPTPRDPPQSTSTRDIIPTVLTGTIVDSDVDIPVRGSTIPHPRPPEWDDPAMADPIEDGPYDYKADLAAEDFTGGADVDARTAVDAGTESDAHEGADAEPEADPTGTAATTKDAARRDATEAAAATGPGPGAMGMDVMLMVSDLETSLSFYHGLLRLPVLDSTATTAVLSYGGGQIILQEKPDMSPVERRVMHLHIRVKDVEAVQRDLRAKGVTFAHRPTVIRPTDRHEIIVATCHDPDGHAVSLTEWRDRS